MGVDNNEFVCLLCRSSLYPDNVFDKLRDDSSDTFKVVRCSSCLHTQLFPLPTAKENRIFYETDSQTRNVLGEVDFTFLKKQATVDTARRVSWLQSILPVVENIQVLDVGCGYGFFVNALCKLGYQATGLDTSSKRLSMARR